MSEIPTPVSESTAIEIVRVEGATDSEKAVGTIDAGALLYFGNNSGVVHAIKAVDGNSTIGAALFDAVSGERVTFIKGRVKVKWDGTGTVNAGTIIVNSDLVSGWFEPLGAVTSGSLELGHSAGSLAAANSGTLVEVVLNA